MKQLLIIAMFCCLILFMGCGSEKSDSGDSKTGEETAAPSGALPYKRALDRAKDVDKSAQERNDRISEEAEK